MSGEFGAYTFLPWALRGIAKTVSLGDGASGICSLATVPVDVRLSGSTSGGGTLNADIHRDVALFGPVDIVGLDRRAIVRMEPRPGITDFEPNYIPFVEFYDED